MQPFTALEFSVNFNFIFMGAHLFFHATVKVVDRFSKKKFEGKFIGVGKTANSVKSYIETQVAKEFPSGDIKVSLLRMSSVQGLFIESLPTNEKKEDSKVGVAE